jgi:hypothetical protein
MTSVTDLSVRSALRRAAVRATLAPSVHNTQPWHLRLDAENLEVYADPARQLRVLDPRGRQLLISCGCAVFNARVALSGSGYEPIVSRFPDASRPNLLAQISARPHSDVDRTGLAHLDPVIDIRRTNRRRFADELVPAEVTSLLVEAARSEGGILLPITRPDHRRAAAALSQQADQFENSDPAYRAELRAWTSDDPTRNDGVPATTVPHVDAGSHDDIPIRDFDTHGAGTLPTETRSSLNQCLLLLGTLADTPASWLRAGEALERVQLEVARLGYACSPFTQLIEIAATNAALRAELQLTMNPHVLLRVGRAPATPLTRRRRLVDVLDEVY